MSHIVPHTKNENATTSGSYEHVKYHKFCIITKKSNNTNSGQYENSNIANSSSYEKGKCHYFCLVRNIQISQILHSTKNSNITNSISYGKGKYYKFCFVRKIKIKKILLRTKKVKYHKLCLIPELLNQRFVVALQSGMTQFMPCTEK